MEWPVSESALEGVLSRARRGRGLEAQEIALLLQVEEKEHLEAVFSPARVVRRRHFGERVFQYGFVYFSTHCRNDCAFCLYRRSNAACRRYRKDEGEIVAISRQLTTSGAHLVDLTMGEDPAYFGKDGFGLAGLVDVVRSVREATGRPVMVSPGLVPRTILSDLRDVGATWYACYQETHTRALFHKLRPGQDYDSRLRVKSEAHELGLLIEEGVLVGVGETSADLVASIAAMQALDADQVRVMSLVPQQGTPMAGMTPPAPARELLVLAVLRLVLQDRLIPASLDVEGLAGLKMRLDAGANVVTSLVPPEQGLAGVSQSTLDISNGRRSCVAVGSVLDACGLRVASPEEYSGWIERRRGELARIRVGLPIAC